MVCTQRNAQGENSCGSCGKILTVVLQKNAVFYHQMEGHLRLVIGGELLDVSGGGWNRRGFLYPIGAHTVRPY